MRKMGIELRGKAGHLPPLKTLDDDAQQIEQIQITTQMLDNLYMKKGITKCSPMIPYKTPL